MITSIRNVFEIWAIWAISYHQFWCLIGLIAKTWYFIKKWNNELKKNTIFFDKKQQKNAKIVYVNMK